MPHHIAGRKIDPRVPIMHNENWVYLDGDVDKITLLDESSDGRFPVNFGLGKSGRPVDPTYMPTRIRRKGNRGLPIYDVDITWGGGLHVTERFKSIVEAFEPGVHQFFPIQIEQGGKVIAERFIFFICNRLDTLAKDQCVPPVGPDAQYCPIHDGNDRVVFDSTKIGAHHAWHDRFTLGRMVSNALCDELNAQDFTGFSSRKYDQT